eukprot:1334655-Amorphochlora_amoeboformis.AAC.2
MGTRACNLARDRCQSAMMAVSATAETLACGPEVGFDYMIIRCSETMLHQQSLHARAMDRPIFQNSSAYVHNQEVYNVLWRSRDRPCAKHGVRIPCKITAADALSTTPRNIIDPDDQCLIFLRPPPHSQTHNHILRPFRF